MNKYKLFYSIKPLVPRRFQISVRQRIAKRKRHYFKDVWPIDPGAWSPPKGWSGWPQQKKFALVLTHDVDTERGQQRCPDLMEMEKEIGFRSSFNFVPERYPVSHSLRHTLQENGFEVGVHGLNHDGKLYESEDTFRRKAAQINRYMGDWLSVGFRSPSMHHNLDWIRQLNIEYDASTFDTDPFEPQPDGVRTIFPFWVEGDGIGSGYVELPYTLPQDFTLFVLMQEKTIEIWIRKLDWVAANGGMVLVNVHPDYMNFDGSRMGPEEYPADYYSQLLNYIKSRYEGMYWHGLPKDIARFWKNHQVQNIMRQ